MYPPQGTDQPALHRLRHFHSKKSHELPKAGKKTTKPQKGFCDYIIKNLPLHPNSTWTAHLLARQAKKAGLLTRSLRVLPFPALM
jgi:hypothetical protein